MPQHPRIRTLVAATVAVSLALGCASQPGSSPTAGDVFGGDCNPLIAGGIGAALGALVGGRDRVRGAAIGAGVGALACVGYNYYTKQTKSAQQVTDEYKAAHRGTLPARATVTRFNTNVQPNANVPAGSAVTVVSYIEVVPGSDNPRPSVEQQIALYSPDGKEVANARKPANESSGGGGFETSFRFTLPQGVPQGVYPVRSQVFVNGQPAANADALFQIVVGPAGTNVTMARLPPPPLEP